MPNTPRFDLEKPAHGSNIDTWDVNLNSNFDKIDAAAKQTDVTSAVSTHEAAGNPHPTYETSAEAQAKVDTHAAAGDPHPTYLTSAEGDTKIATHEAAGNPHPTYETSAEAQAKVDTHAGAADPHTGYVLESLVDAKGDLIVATGDNAVTRLGAGTNGRFLRAASGQSEGLEWFDHEGAADPHPTYLTSAEGDTKITNHEAAANPHPTYETSAEAQSKVDTHTALPNAHHNQNHATAQHTDVDVSGIDDGWILEWDTGLGMWVAVAPTAATTLAGLSDVNIAGITDGQLIAWNSATSKFLPVGQAGNPEIAYAENITGTATTIAGGASANGTPVDIPGVNISVPATARPVWLEVGANATQTVTGTGRGVMLLVETTSGSVTIEQKNVNLPNSTATRGNEVGLQVVRKRLGVTTGTRTFKLQVRCDGAGATPSISVPNISGAGSYIHAWSE